MSTPDGIKRASFTVVGSSAQPVPVHFNPESLQYSVTNQLDNKGSGNSKKQYVSSSTGKLTMDLVFDTTDSGQDVRLDTGKVAGFMEPAKDKVPPIVKFEWGVYTFQGMVESFKETVDFFSSDGVPLRASVNISMASQDKVFEPSSDGTKSSKTDGNLKSNSSIPQFPPAGRGATDTATRGGNPDAARGLAAASGAESMRFPGRALAVDEQIDLKGPETFASASAGVGIAAGFAAGGGAGIGADLGIGASAGIDLGTTAGASAGLSAGASASAGTFAGLKLPPPPSLKLNVDNFIDADVTASIGIEAEAGIGLGGAADATGSASIRADVGSPGELSARIEFKGG